MRIAILLALTFACFGCQSANDDDMARQRYSRPPTVTMKAPQVVLQLRSGDFGRIYLPARIGNSGVLLMVDTGATPTIVDEQVLRGEKIEMIQAPEGVLYGGGGASKGFVARIPKLDLGGCSLDDMPVFATNYEEWNRRESAVQKVVIGGILGSEVLKLLNARIDYQAGTLVIQNPNKAVAQAP
jgi:predicted aspartyl protease